MTIRIDEEALDYFRELAAELEIPYQTLINSYLCDCAERRRRRATRWRGQGAGRVR